MAKKTSDADVHFTTEEVAALRAIAVDWLNEGLVSPPYDAATGAALAKLGVAPVPEGRAARERPAELAADDAGVAPPPSAPIPNLG